MSEQQIIKSDLTTPIDVSSRVTNLTIFLGLFMQVLAPLLGFLSILCLSGPQGPEYTFASIIYRSTLNWPKILALAPEPFIMAVIASMVVAGCTRSAGMLYRWNTVIAIVNGLVSGFLVVGRSM